MSERPRDPSPRQIIRRLDLSSEERRRLVGVLRVALSTVDGDYRANVAAIARDLGKSRRTVYNWADRVLESSVQLLREMRVGRPPKEGTEEA